MSRTDDPTVFQRIPRRVIWKLSDKAEARPVLSVGILAGSGVALVGLLLLQLFGG